MLNALSKKALTCWWVIDYAIAQKSLISRVHVCISREIYVSNFGPLDHFESWPDSNKWPKSFDRVPHYLNGNHCKNHNIGRLNYTIQKALISVIVKGTPWIGYKEVYLSLQKPANEDVPSTCAMKIVSLLKRVLLKEKYQKYETFKDDTGWMSSVVHDCMN